MLPVHLVTVRPARLKIDGPSLERGVADVKNKQHPLDRNDNPKGTD